MLTDRQSQVLAVLVDRWSSGKPMPSLRELCGHFDIKSTNGISDHLKGLEKKGAIRRPVWGRSRGIELVFTHPDVAALRDAAKGRT
jgi:SOS-response transcriptional repressor LexA